MKRFWQTAAPALGPQGWAILLDGKPLRLPGGPELQVHSPGLADAIAAEWQAAGQEVGGEMSYADVPLTRLAGTAQERIAGDPAAVALEIARYAESDLLCYRAEHPPALAERQAQAWQPWLDWAASRYGARLRMVAGVIHVPQESAALAALAGVVGGYDALRLAALGVAVPVLGSLVLGLAMAEGCLSAAAAHELAALDELYQEGFWGVDAAAALRRAQVLDDLNVASRVFALV